MGKKTNCMRLNFELIAAIKNYSYRGTAEFWRRHCHKMGAGVSRSTFYRALQGEEIDKYTVDAITNYCYNTLHLFNPDTGESAFNALSSSLELLFHKFALCDQNFTPENWASLIQYYKANAEKMLELVRRRV